MAGKNRLYVLFVIAAFMLAGCTASGMKRVEKSGFISDYSYMEQGKDGLPALAYSHPDADLSGYNKILIEKICVCMPGNDEKSDIEPVVLQELADYYDHAITSALIDKYEIVDKPGPGVLTVRAAITDVKPASPIINTISSVSPLGIAIATATKIVTDKNLGTGEAASEMEIADSLTGERFTADVDRRQGGKMIFRDRWTDAKHAFDHWAKHLRSRLESMCCKDRNRADL